MKKNNYFTITLLSLILIVSCNKDFLEVSDPNNIDKAKFWVSEENAEKAVNAIYSSMKEPEFLGLNYHKYASFISGEYDNPYSQDQDRVEFVNFTLKSENRIIWLMWKDIFRCIMRCNDVISHVPEISDEMISQNKKDQFIGEAYFLRGLSELYCFQMFGKYYPDKDTSALGIPIITKVAPTREDMFVTRNSAGSSYRQIISDFNKAKDLLPESYDNTNIGRATKGAAIAYIARTNMWMGYYDEAIEAYDELFTMNLYQLVDNYYDNFNGTNENNTESIFEMQFEDITPLNPWKGGAGQPLATEFAPPQLGRGNAAVSFETSDYYAKEYTITQGYLDSSVTSEMPADMYSYISSLVGQNVDPVVFRQNLIDMFSSDTYYDNMVRIYKYIDGSWDPRWKATAFQPGDSVLNGNIYTYDGANYRPKKFVDPNINSNNSSNLASSVNIVIFRLGYAYLQYAEAQNEIGDLVTACEYVNKLRHRAYNSNPALLHELDPAALTTEQFIDTLKLESFREICGEFTRWQDIVRWGDTEKYCDRRGFVKGIHEVLPIPIDELDLNPNMEQNLGY
ncbi:RagB/SusD family nutrient uptake outer membrane protein [Bacteroidota bacterium]